MKNKILIGLLAVLLYSCGSTNKVRTTTSTKEEVEKKEVKTVKEDVVVEEKKTEDKEKLDATSNVSTTSSTVHDYINQFKEVAKNNMKDYKIPASITLAQGILESGAGKGRLCLEANNHFGIKCHKGWTGPSITHDDDALQECFRKYNDPAESYRDHSKFLTSRSRYNGLFDLDILDYKGWANGLKKAGYATDPKYPSKLIGIIERYQLFLYDHEVVENKNTEVIVKEVEEKEEANNKDVSSITIVEVKEATQDEVENAVVEVEQVNENVEETISDKNLYQVQKGDTLYSLSKRFDTTVEAIMKLNNLKDYSLSVGQEIKIK